MDNREQVKQLQPTMPASRFGAMANSILQAHKQTNAVLADRMLRLTEAALALDSHPATLRRGIRAGTIKAVRIGKRGLFKIALSEIRRLRGEIEP
jgi:hypothetical protein